MTINTAANRVGKLRRMVFNKGRLLPANIGNSLIIQPADNSPVIAAKLKQGTFSKKINNRSFPKLAPKLN